VNSPVSVSTTAMLCCRACRSQPTMFISASFVPSLFGWTPQSLLGLFRGRRRYEISHGRLLKTPIFCFSNRSRRLSCIAVQAKLLGTKDEGPDILPRMENRSLRDVGGTPGGLGSFLFGFAMACVGGYLLANQVSVIGSYWSFYGGSTFGITLLPLLIGVGILFWSGKNIVGWLLTIAGALFILAGVIANMHIYFRPTSLFNTLVMLILFVGGLGLIARALMPQGKNANE
jgi:hypothetical protein